jgi:sugar phosphate isomerase/epimerase
MLCHNDLLEAYSDEIIGIHLHDVRGHKDHLAPGQGGIDYQKIKPFLNSSIIKILVGIWPFEKTPILLTSVSKTGFLKTLKCYKYWRLNPSRVNMEELLEGIRLI